jgi:hypothetical protein
MMAITTNNSTKVNPSVLRVTLISRFEVGEFSSDGYACKCLQSLLVYLIKNRLNHGQISSFPTFRCGGLWFVFLRGHGAGKAVTEVGERLEEFFCFVQGKGVAVTFTIGWQRTNHHNDG